MADVKVHLKVNYLPEEGLFRWQMGEADGQRITLTVTPEVFAKMVEYLELVLSSYSSAKRNEKS